MAKQERALRTREALVNSAAAVFDRDGYSAASLSAISALAGVSNGALHFHFESKAHLAGSVEEAAVRRLDRIVAAGEAASGGSALQSLVNASHELARRLGEDVVLRAGFELGRDQAREEGHGLWRYWHGSVEEALTRAAAEGALGEVAPDAVVRSVVAATVGFEVLGDRDPRWLSDRTITGFWQLLLPLVAAPSALGGLAAEGIGTKKTARAV